MSRLRTSLILDSGLDYHRRLDEREQGGKGSAVSQRTDIENGQVQVARDDVTIPGSARASTIGRSSTRAGPNRGPSRHWRCTPAAHSSTWRWPSPASSTPAGCVKPPAGSKPSTTGPISRDAVRAPPRSRGRGSVLTANDRPIHAVAPPRAIPSPRWTPGASTTSRMR